MESPGETVVHPPRIDRMGARCKVLGAKCQVQSARCKVAGAGQDRPISFNSQPQAYWPSNGDESSTPAADC